MLHSRVYLPHIRIDANLVCLFLTDTQFQSSTNLLPIVGTFNRTLRTEILKKPCFFSIELCR